MCWEGGEKKTEVGVFQAFYVMHTIELQINIQVCNMHRKYACIVGSSICFDTITILLYITYSIHWYSSVQINYKKRE